MADPDRKARLFAVGSAGATPAADGGPPRVALVPIELASQPALREFAFELARALAAQTARVVGVVVVEPYRGGAGFVRRRGGSRGPLEALRIEPFAQRESVLFYGLEHAADVISAARGHVPVVLIDPAGKQAAAGLTATVIATGAGARSDYLDLVRGEIESQSGAAAHVAVLDEAVRGGIVGAALGRRSAAPFRPLAWTIAAELC